MQEVAGGGGSPPTKATTSAISRLETKRGDEKLDVKRVCTHTWWGYVSVRRVGRMR